MGVMSARSCTLKLLKHIKLLILYCIQAPVICIAYFLYFRYDSIKFNLNERIYDYNGALNNVKLECSLAVDWYRRVINYCFTIVADIFSLYSYNHIYKCFISVTYFSLSNIPIWCIVYQYKLPLNICVLPSGQELILIT